MKKINKREARKCYNNGTSIKIIPCLCNPYSIWYSGFGGAFFNKEDYDGKDFDKVCNEIMYYQCNKDTGYRLSYYIKD